MLQTRYQGLLDEFSGPRSTRPLLVNRGISLRFAAVRPRSGHSKRRKPRNSLLRELKRLDRHGEAREVQRRNRLREAVEAGEGRIDAGERIEAERRRIEPRGPPLN
jgi:hypothetical protein